MEKHFLKSREWKVNRLTGRSRRDNKYAEAQNKRLYTEKVLCYTKQV